VFVAPQNGIGAVQLREFCMCMAIISQQMAGAQWSFREFSLWQRDYCYVESAMLPGRHFSRGWEELGS
jgi:hypothetical protein